MIPVSVSEILARGRILTDDERDLVQEEIDLLIDAGGDAKRLNSLGDFIRAYEVANDPIL